MLSVWDRNHFNVGLMITKMMIRIIYTTMLQPWSQPNCPIESKTIPAGQLDFKPTAECITLLSSSKLDGDGRYSK